MPLSKAPYHTCFICGHRCKCWSFRPKLTSSAISDINLSFTFTFTIKGCVCLLWQVLSLKLGFLLHDFACVIRHAKSDENWTDSILYLVIPYMHLLVHSRMRHVYEKKEDHVANRMTSDEKFGWEILQMTSHRLYLMRSSSLKHTGVASGKQHVASGGTKHRGAATLHGKQHS